MILLPRDEGDSGPHYDISYFLVPIVIFAVFPTMLAYLKYRRRRQRQNIAAIASARNLAMASAAGPTPGSYHWHSSQTRRNNRRGARSTSATAPANPPPPEEGLNELGEAPPAYTQKGPDVDATAGPAAGLPNYDEAAAASPAPPPRAVLPPS
ncbi:hypothetical protein F4780DRAFT_652407 [Xylariomycetidae sp. FL0641]|nr:hypothetical protein F4780DRAFT_652407 [Xylariomycetidae sp. FL0641]